jgi:hypothetical protein
MSTRSNLSDLPVGRRANQFNFRATAQLARWKRPEKVVARKIDFRKDFQADLGRPVPPAKTLPFLIFRNRVYGCAFRTDKRDVRVVTNVERECGGRDGAD